MRCTSSRVCPCGHVRGPAPLRALSWMSVTGGGGGVPVARPRSAAMTRASAGHQGGAFTVSAERVPDVKIDAASRVLHQNASNTVGENRGGRRSADTWTRLCGSSWGQKSGAGHLKTRGRVPWTMEFASGRGAVVAGKLFASISVLLRPWNMHELWSLRTHTMFYITRLMITSSLSQQAP